MRHPTPEHQQGSPVQPSVPVLHWHGPGSGGCSGCDPLEKPGLQVPRGRGLGRPTGPTDEALKEHEGAESARSRCKTRSPIARRRRLARPQPPHPPTPFGALHFLRQMQWSAPSKGRRDKGLREGRRGRLSGGGGGAGKHTHRLSMQHRGPSVVDGGVHRGRGVR